MGLLQRLWRDECGGLQSCELVFLSAILVIGVVPGIALVRDALLCELSDFACAICRIDCWDHDHGNGHGNNHGNGHGNGNGNHGNGNHGGWPGQGWHNGWGNGNGSNNGNGWGHNGWGDDRSGRSGLTSGRGLLTAGQLFAGNEQ